MRIAFVCKRRYMSKDVILDRYARLYEIPRQLALLGHDVHGFCLDYQGAEEGVWEHDGGAGRLRWRSRALGLLRVPGLVAYPRRVLRDLRAFAPDIVMGASDIPHVALGAWLAKCLARPYVADLYDNFEGFGQARIPGFVGALRWGVRQARLITTTSEPLRDFVRSAYRAQGHVIAMPSSVDHAVFHPRDKQSCREALGLPTRAKLIGTAGGLYRDKGVEPIYAAWRELSARHPDVHLVLAGPVEAQCAVPAGERVHYLGMLAHEQVATLFGALDVGIISILDTPFGRYCFPQKAYEMLACGLPVAAADVGAMSTLFADCPSALFKAGNAESMVQAVARQLDAPLQSVCPIDDWTALVRAIEPRLVSMGAPRGTNAVAQ